MPENDWQDSSQNSSVFKNIPRKQKIAIFALAVGAIVIVVFWVWEFNNRLVSPFTADSDKKVNTVVTNSSSTVAVVNLDTDHDGLSDADEINIYHTSPYLEDTDSDGISDNDEVKNGTDPTCPMGKVCNGSDNTVIASSTNLIGTSTLETPNLSLPTDMASSSQQVLQDALDGKADAATLRQLLLTSGADKSMLDQISDEDLMKSYQETLKNNNN
jgi:hypothetical protein